MGGADPIRKVGEIVKKVTDRQPVLVVSAVGGITDRLFSLGQSALLGGAWRDALGEICDRHRSILGELGLSETLVDPLLEELRGLVGGISLIRELTPRTRDYLVSFGERLSARLVASHLESVGVPAVALDAFDAGLLTDSRFGSARPLADSEARIRQSLQSLRDGEEIPVITGYIGKDEEGAITTLGRGGSDFSAAVFGAALGAEEIQIWTDVDGVMSADPRIVGSATHLPKLNFAEASELAFYGAKVIHPAAMVPAVRRDIPIRVLNTYRPEFEGTTIVSRLAASERGVKSITSKSRVSMINVVAPPMALQFGFVERIADAFKRREIVIDMISTSEVSVTLTTDRGPDLEPLVDELSRFSEVTVEHEMAQISVVGEEIRERVGFAAEVFDVLRRLEINVEMISFGATRINLSFVVSSDRVRDAVQGLHDHLFGR